MRAGDTHVYITGTELRRPCPKSAKTALAKGAARAGTASCTGDGGMLPEERGFATTMIYQLNASRYGVSPRDMVQGDAIEIVVGRGPSQPRGDC